MVTGINHITFAVEDLERSFVFYSEILGMKAAARWENGAYLEAGNHWIALLVDPKISFSEKPDYSHVAFDCSANEFERIKARIIKYGSPSWQENSSEGHSYYFNDPDGHKLEIHIGDLETRLSSMRQNPWAEFKFYR